jgi:hypothetical protein
MGKSGALGGVTKGREGEKTQANADNKHWCRCKISRQPFNSCGVTDLNSANSEK